MPETIDIPNTTDIPATAPLLVDSDKLAKLDEIKAKTETMLRNVLGREPLPHEAANSSTDVGLLAQVIMHEIVDIKLRLDAAKL